jgi:site-specific DNA-methyltransferase (adenine-specific)
MNALYYGDNLKVLRDSIATESVDLVYLDPPFNSSATYNVLFKAPSGEQSQAQIEAFEDTWHWNESAERAFDEVVTGPHSDAAIMLRAMRSALGENDMMAYLAMMAVRLLELHRVLKPTGALYLHCDPTASHYLTILLDAVFYPLSYRNEIIWKRQSAHNDARKKYADITDTIFYYAKSNDTKFHVVRRPLDPGYVSKFYRFKAADGRVYRLSDLRSPNPRPNLMYAYKGYKPHENGWAVSRERMEELDNEGRLQFPKSLDGRISLKRYLDENEGAVVPNVKSRPIATPFSRPIMTPC